MKREKNEGNGAPGEEGKRNNVKDGILQTGKEFLLAVFIIVLLLSLTYGYTGNWPPMVVVESGSMKHGPPDESDIGVIDPGDLVLVKSVSQRTDIITYLEGAPSVAITLSEGGEVVLSTTHHGGRSPHATYGEYGDVIVYYKNGYGSSVPIIHRAIMWVEYNATARAFDIPSIPVHGFKGNITLHAIGYRKMDLTVDLGRLMDDFERNRVLPHGGFITLGDHNNNYDQAGLVDIYYKPVQPVMVSWILGKARGELPWFGAIKLYLGDEDPNDGRGREAIPAESWRGLYFTIGGIVILAAVGDAVTYMLEK
ncbi:MAG: S26 family signal peptidase, partial [Thermoplasmata archaeon]|nr:S26 family signal peptidase [Thermoplasmata archaeon]